MPILESEPIGNVGLGRKISSEVFGIFDKHIFPQEAKAKIKGLLRSGVGVIITANHPSEMDPPKILAMLFEDGFFRRTHIAAPVGAHQMSKAQFANRLFNAQIDLIPIVNNHTIVKDPNMNKRRGEGLRRYLITAVETLREGGIVLVFFQAGRKPKVGVAREGDVVLGGLFKILDKFDVKPAIAFLGVSIPGVNPQASEYRKAVSPYLLQVGEVLTREELEGELNGHGQKVDEYAFDRVRELVTPEYK